MRTLMRHQKMALEYALPRARIALFMEMRLGKTLVALRWADNEDCKKTLILAPKAVTPVWEDELQQERFPDEEILLLSGPTNERYIQAKESKAQWTITNFETINYCPEILELPWDCLLVDESTRIKNPKAAITKLLINKAHMIRYRGILSGLPAPESEMDYCEQFRFLYGNFMHESNFWWWRKRYFYKIGYEWKPNWNTIQKIQEAISSMAFVMTAKEAGIKHRKIYEKRYIELTEEQKNLYKEIDKNFEYETKQGEYQTTKYVPVKLGWMQRIAGGFDPNGKLLSNRKLLEILNLFKGDLKGKQAVIWFKHTAELESAREFFTARKFTVAFFNAKEKVGEKEFKEGKRQLMLAQAKCGQYGLNWSAADVAIYYSNWWSGETRAQTEKRIEHPKKKRPLLYIDIVCDDTVDLDVLNALRSKKKTSRGFLNEVIKSWRKRHGIFNN